MSGLERRVVIVTGASRRIAIGAAIVRRLAADGAAILLHAWAPHDAEQPWGADADGPAALIGELREQGARVKHVSADLADPESPAALVEAARDAFGHVDAVVANHARSSGPALEELTAAELDRSYAVHTRSTLLLVKAFAAQHDDRRRGGRVLLFTSGQYHGAMPAGGRWSTPADTARLVAWLLSDEADWVTGQTIASDGGWSAR